MKPALRWAAAIGSLCFIGAIAGFATAKSAVVGVRTTAPGGPGKLGTWSRPDKTGYGTTRNRPLWFTIADGALSEIAYPTVDLVQTRDSFLMIRDSSGRVATIDERKSCQHTDGRYAGTLAYHIDSRCPGVTIRKDFVPSPSDDGMIVEYQVEFSTPGKRQLVFVHNPTAAATPGGDSIQVALDDKGLPSLVATQVDVRGDEPQSIYPNTVQSVSWNLAPSKATVGFEGVNSPEDQIQNGSFPQFYDQASFGNVAGGLVYETDAQKLQFRVALTFSASRDLATLYNRQAKLLSTPSRSLFDQQKSEWALYLASLKYDRGDLLAESSILLLKALEDKFHPGALIAAPANPALPWFNEAPEQNYEDSRRRHGDSNSGYRRVWPRDLYHKALAFLSVGDLTTPVNTLRWYRGTQLRDGTWSQNMWVDGAPSWTGYQADQTAFPIVLAWRLAELGRISYPEYRDMVRRAANTLVTRGPVTAQERWEENGGLSPNTFAAVVEGLRAAAWLETLPGGDAKAADQYAAKANEWAGNMKNWLLIQNGALGQRYFARMEISNPWDPSRQDMMTIANKKPGQPSSFREDQILDGGFLEWILAGLVDPRDADFSGTLALYDRYLRKSTPAGLGYIRYNEDSYGENQIGGAWPLLSAERAIAAIERGEPYTDHLKLILGLSTTAQLIGEQDTLAVRPLGWSHASYLILRKSMQDGRSFYIPQKARH